MKINWQKLKSGTTLYIYSWMQKVIFVRYHVGQYSDGQVVLIPSGSNPEFYSPQELNQLGDIEVRKAKMAKVASFVRSDSYVFIVWKADKRWQLKAGCHWLDETTLKKLHKQVNEHWEDGYKLEGFKMKSANDRRRNLNKETRKKFAKLVAKLKE